MSEQDQFDKFARYVCHSLERDPDEQRTNGTTAWPLYAEVAAITRVAFARPVNAFAALAEHLGREDLNVDLVQWYEALTGRRSVDSLDLPEKFDTVDRADIGHKE